MKVNWLGHLRYGAERFGVEVPNQPKQDAPMTCIGCNLPPDQIAEYIDCAAEENMTPEAYLIQEEGTYNGFEPNRFYCTPCYIKAGMPLINGGNE